MTAGQVVGSTFLGGLRAPNYVNGRLLSAEDLKADQEAVRARLAALGQAVGHGVVDGLEVKAGTRQVTVTAGLGVNREGGLVRLPSAVTLNVAPEPGQGTPPRYDRFENCERAGADGKPGRIDAGAYVLVARPASQLEDRVPVKSATTAPAGCVGKWEVNGVEFRAFRLGWEPPAHKSDLLAASASVHDTRRNLLAHWCFGTAALQGLARDPFTFGPTWGGLDEVGIPPADLPLAVFVWTGAAIDFVDLWSARRRVVAPDALTGWHALLADARAADSQARFLQFQQQVDELVVKGLAPGVQAANVFRFLPPAGFLPLAPASLLARLDAMAGGAFIKPKRPTVDWGGRLKGVLADSPTLGRTSANDLLFIEPSTAVFNAALGNLQDELRDVRFEFDALSRSGVGEAGAQPVQPAVSESRRRRQSARDKEQSKRINALRLALRSLPRQAGFDLERFFGALPSRIGIVDRETVDFTLQRSWYDEPIDLAPPLGEPTGYNVFLVEDSLTDKGTAPYVLFAKAIKPISWLPLGKQTR
jgi:hypothetical protein